MVSPIMQMKLSMVVQGFKRVKVEVKRTQSLGLKVGHTTATAFYSLKQSTWPAEILILMERVPRNLW